MALVHRVRRHVLWYITNTKYIFPVKVRLFVTAESGHDPDPHWFGSLDPDPDLIEIKSWIRIRNTAKNNMTAPILRFKKNYDYSSYFVFLHKKVKLSFNYPVFVWI